MGCSSSKHQKHNEKIKGEMMSKRCELDKSKRLVSSLLHNLVHEEFRRNITEVYDLHTGRPLGAGSFGTVRAVIHRSSGKEFALKTVELKGLKDAAQFQVFMNEVEIMKKLDHPSVARLQEVYHAPDYVFMVMDLYSGGDLVDRQRIRTERDAAAVIKDVVDGIRYCHDHEIAHRDLKLENILYEHKGADAGIKIVDFGLGTSGAEALIMRDIVGTWIYMSPEVLKGRHSPYAIDMWSIGIITYTLMVGYFPFIAESLQHLQYQIQNNAPDMSSENWKVVTEECKDFISKLLIKEPERRMTAKEAQCHPWLNMKTSKTTLNFNPPLASDVTDRLKSFKDQSVLKRVALEIVARTLEPKQICSLEAEFRKADKERKGELSLETFREVMRESALLRDKDIDQIFRSLDVGSCGTVHFTDFLAAGLKWQRLDERRLRLAFDRLDHSNTGYITLEGLQFTVGSDLSDEQIKAAIAEFDDDKDGKIGFAEFCAGMRKSGADLGALSTATISNRNTTAMSRMVSNQTLQRLAQGMEPDSDDEVYAGGDADYDDESVYDGDGGRAKAYEKHDKRHTRICKSEINLHGEDYAKILAQRNQASLGKIDPSLQAAATSIFMRRATSETGKDINTATLHTKQVSNKVLERNLAKNRLSFKTNTINTSDMSGQSVIAKNYMGLCTIDDKKTIEL